MSRLIKRLPVSIPLLAAVLVCGAGGFAAERNNGEGQNANGAASGSSKPAGDKVGGSKEPLSQAERIAQGKDLVDSICFWCHEPALMYPMHLNQEEWAGLIRGMIYEGAPVTDEEFSMIVEYLASRFGPLEEQE